MHRQAREGLNYKLLSLKSEKMRTALNTKQQPSLSKNNPRLYWRNYSVLRFLFKRRNK